MGELFYALLFHTGYPVLLREKALQVLWLLLTTERVSRKDKVQVLLQERAMFRGLVSLVQNAEIFVSLRMLSSLLDIALLTGTSVCVKFFSHLFTFVALLFFFRSDSASGANAVIALLLLAAKCDVTTRLHITKKVNKYYPLLCCVSLE